MSIESRIDQMEKLTKEWYAMEYYSSQVESTSNNNKRQIEVEREMDSLDLEWDEEIEEWVESLPTPQLVTI